MKKEYMKAGRLARELCEELQRLEHRLEGALPLGASDASDELTQIRSARDSAVEVQERLYELS